MLEKRRRFPYDGLGPGSPGSPGGKGEKRPSFIKECVQTRPVMFTCLIICAITAILFFTEYDTIHDKLVVNSSGSIPEIHQMDASTAHVVPTMTGVRGAAGGIGGGSTRATTEAVASTTKKILSAPPVKRISEPATTSTTTKLGASTSSSSSTSTADENKKEGGIEKVFESIPVDVLASKKNSLYEEITSSVAAIRKMKFEDHVVIETSADAQKSISILQEQLQAWLPMEYGPEPYIMEMTLKFPETMKLPDQPDEMSLVFELGPASAVPYSTYYFLEYIFKEWKSGPGTPGGAFHRNAGHVLQATVHGAGKHLPFAFQEYSPNFPHVKYSMGYAGRPSGASAFYISTVDNTANHGPGSQGSKTEADACFAKVIRGFETVTRMSSQKGKDILGPSGFIKNPDNNIKITGLKRLQ